MSSADYTKLVDENDQDTHYSAFPSTHKPSYAVFFLLGMGFLFPFFSFVTVGDFFNQEYEQILPGGLSVNFFFAAFYNLGSLVVYLFLKLIERYSTYVWRIYIGFAVYFVILTFIPIINLNIDDPILDFVITQLCLFLVGVIAGMMNESVLQFSSIFEDNPIYTQAVMLGIAFASILVVVIRILAKVALSMTASVYVSFMIGSVLMVMCIISTKLLVQSPFCEHHLSRSVSSRRTDKRDAESHKSEYERTEDGMTWREMFQVIRSMRSLPWVIFIGMASSLTVFPGMATNANSSFGIDYDWFNVIVVAVWNVGDVVGRTMAAWIVVFPADKLIYPTVGRSAVIVPLFILFACVHQLQNDIFLLLLVMLSAVSNGYLSTSAMMMTGSVFQDPVNRKKGGIVMGFMLLVGLAAGSFIGIGLGFLLPKRV